MIEITGRTKKFAVEDNAPPMTGQQDSPQQQPGTSRTCLLVLGMHRSGTSAIARVLNLLGAALPNIIMPPAPNNNDAGFWEPARLVALHDQMLTEACSSWNDWQAFDPASLPPGRAAHYKGEIVRLIGEEYGGAALFVLKDPRICRFVPLYDDALAAAGCEPRPVIMIRNPLEVAASLNKRDGMAHDRAVLLWLRHVLDAEAATRGRPRAFLSYDNLLADWKTALDGLAARFGVTWPRAGSEVDGEIGEFLTSAQRHHEIAPERLGDDPAMNTWVAEAFAALRQLERDPVSVEATGKLDAISREFRNAAPVMARLEAEARHREAEFAGQSAALSEAKARAEALAGQLEERDAALSIKERSEQGLHKEMDTLKMKLEKANTESKALAMNLEERKTQLSEHERALTKANLAIKKLENRVRAKEQKVSELKGRVYRIELDSEAEIQKAKTELCSRINSLEIENTVLSDEKKHRDQKIQELEARYEEKSIEIRNLLGKVIDLNDEIIKLSNKKSIIKININRIFVSFLSILMGRNYREMVFNFTPEKDLRFSSAYEGAWEAIGNDPIFYMHETTGARPKGWVELSIDFEVLDESRPTPSIYIDDTHGFREETRVMLPLDKNTITRVVNFPQDTISIRFDPADNPCAFRLRRATAKPLTKLGVGVRLFGSAIVRHRAKGHSYFAIARHGVAYLRRNGWQALKNRLVEHHDEVDHQSAYADWLSRRSADEVGRLDAAKEEIPHFSYKPVFSIVMPTYNSPEKWLVKAIESVRGQVYPYWELCICDDASTDPRVRTLLGEYAEKDRRIKLTFRETNGHISRATNDAMKLMTGEYMCLMDHDDEITPNALYEFAKILNEDRDVEFIYSDEDKISIHGQRYDPFFKPDWSPALLESCMYTAHFACYRNDIVEKTGGFRPECNGAQDYDFVLRFTEHVSNVRHIPRILYHWRAIPGSTAQTMDNKSYVIDAALRALTDRCKRTGEPEIVKPAEYAGSFFVRRKIVGTPLISIVIPSAGRDAHIKGRQIDLLANCIESVQGKSTYRKFEIIVVDNGDLRKSTKRRLEPFGIKFVTYSQPTFNIATKMNMGAEQAEGEYVLFLNDDIEVITDDWLEAMLAAVQMPGVGMVGAKLHFEDGRLQHVGVTGSDGWPDHLRRGYPANDPGYFFSSVTTREVLAVTGACVLMPLDLFWQVGGFNEDFAVNYNDIDLCVKVRNKGKRILQTSQARLFHFESLNRIRSVDREELQLWEELNRDLFRHDPYYSPIMAISPPSYEPDFAGRGNLI